MICFTYHSITDDDIPLSINAGGKHVSRAMFEKQMQFLHLKSKLIKSLNISDYQKNDCLITIDDGFKNNYTNAFPIFKKYDIPFIIFLCTSFLDNKLIWTDELLKLSLSIIDFKKYAEDWLNTNKLRYDSDLLGFNYLRVELENKISKSDQIGDMEISKNSLEKILDNEL